MSDSTCGGGGGGGGAAEGACYAGSIDRRERIDGGRFGSVGDLDLVIGKWTMIWRRSSALWSKIEKEHL